jgi:Domain of unknown function (DUF4403)
VIHTFVTAKRGFSAMRHIKKAVYIWLALLLPVLASCSKDVGNPAPPRIETAANLPKELSTIVVPLTVPVSEIEARLNQITPARLWTINQFEPRCIPAQRVTICPLHKTKCKGKECKNIACKIGIKSAKFTPDVGCNIVGQVTRGRIRLGGRGDALSLTMPVNAVISARDVGGVIKQETATGSANVRATVKMSINNAWAPVAKVNIDYNWVNPPGINFLGKRISFVDKADAKLAGVIAGLERDLAREIARVQTRQVVADAWAQGFTSILLNRERPPAWMRITPQHMSFGGYRVNGANLELMLAAEAITETFIGDKPDNPEKTPLPPPAAISADRGLRFHIPVLADYAQLEPVVERTLDKLAKRGITLDNIGPVHVKFGKVTVYATEGGRLAVGIKAKADIIRSPLPPTHGEIWLSAIPYNESNSQVIKVRDLKLTGQTDHVTTNLLFSLFANDEVLAEISAALTHDFKDDYDKVMVAAKKAISMRREGDFILTAEVNGVSHGTVLVTGQGLFLPVDVTGNAHIRYSPLKRR